MPKRGLWQFFRSKKKREAPDKSPKQAQGQVKVATKKPNVKPSALAGDELTRQAEKASLLAPLKPEQVVFNPFGRFADVVKNNVAEFGLNTGEWETSEEALRKRLSLIGVVAFIGPSGTGKSTRVIKIASDYQIGYIIDDGLLIHGSSVVAGISAKTAKTKIDSVRQALFADPTRANNMRRALAEHLPTSLLILGTSEGMLQKICDNLWLNQPSIRLRIEDFTTESERQHARHTRLTQGKHTIPVPSMEIKQDFSGHLLEPLLKLRRKFLPSDRDDIPSEGERTVVRPTFSTLGNYSIADNALISMSELLLQQVEGVNSLVRSKIVSERYGAIIDLDVALDYGFNAQEVLQNAQNHLAKSLEEYTAINIVALNLRATKLAKK